MKNEIVTYGRISTDEKKQKHSLSTQKTLTSKYAEQNNLQVAAHFQDDASGFDFDRSGWKALVKYCKTHKRTISKIIVVEWTRFSRNSFEAPEVVKSFLEIGIEVNAIEQTIDYNDPNHPLLLAIHISTGHVYRNKLSQDVKKSIVTAKRNGYWPHQAPYGYDNHRINGKGSLQPNEDAKYVRRAYELMSTKSFNIAETFIQLRKESKGRMKLSKTQFNLMLKRSVYASKIEAMSPDDTTTEYADGKHEPIISPSLFFKVQRILSHDSRDGLQMVQNNPEFPLRGFIKCPHDDHNLTASNSRSRNGNQYGYYHCRNGCKTRHRSDELHEKFYRMLRSYTIPKGYREMVNLVFGEVARQFEGDKHREMQKLKDDKERLESMKAKVEDKYFSDEIETADYKAASSRYIRKIEDIDFKLEILDELDSDFESKLSFAVNFLSNLPKYFDRANTNQKKQILGSIIMEKLVFDGEKYRTPVLNPAIHMLCKNNKGFRGKKKGIESQNDDQSRYVPGAGVEPAQPQWPQDFK